MTKKLADSGLNYRILKDTFANEGLDKTIAILEKRNNGKPTVIKSKKILNIISDRLRNDLPKVI